MTKALITGAGIAGPAAAIALHKAGIDAAVFEAYPAEAGEAGAFVTIAANGQDALQAIDVLEPVLEASFPAGNFRLSDAAGTRVADIPLGRDFPAPHTLTRAALSRVLRAEATRRGIPLTHGKRFTTATCRDGQITAMFADGSHADADLLIGADGIHSPVRTLIDPAAPAPRHIGLTVACGYADHVRDITDPAGYHMIYGSRGFFGYTMAPDHRIWWFARIPGPELTPADLSAPHDHWRKTLAGAFADDDSPATAIINSTREHITITSPYDIPALPTWHNDSMVVIGDAAHAASPSTAQGVSMAIEDAVILAQCLRDHPPIPEALSAYEMLRRERAERVVQAGTGAANPKPPAPGARQPGSVDWLFKHHIDWDDLADAAHSGCEPHS